MAILYALLSLVFAGFNDLVFKRYGDKPRSIGCFMMGIGVVWVGVFAALGMVGHPMVVDRRTLCYGVLSGLLSATANVIFIAAIRRVGVGIGATIYRLNLVFVALIAVVFLHEPLTIPKLAGVLLAVLTVLLMAGNGAAGPRRVWLGRFIVWLLFASFLRACMGIVYKLAASAGVPAMPFLMLNGVGWLALGGIYWFLRERREPLEGKTMAYALLSGLFITGIVFFLRRATDCGEASVVVTVSQLSFLVTYPLAVLFFHEKPSWRRGLGILAAIGCVIAFML
jgi:drug/metabolite transporter (DMT)-like permease